MYVNGDLTEKLEVLGGVDGRERGGDQSNDRGGL